MTRKIRMLIVLVCAIAVAGLCVVVVLRYVPEKTQAQVETEVYMVADYDAAQLTAIEILNVVGERYTIYPENLQGAVRVSGIEKDVPLRQSTLAAVIRKLSQIVSYSKPITLQDGRLSEYGLEEPSAVYSLMMQDGTTHTYRVGAQTVKQNGYYLWEENAAELYIVENAYQTIASYGAWDYIELTLAAVNQERGFTITELSVQGPTKDDVLTVRKKTDAEREGVSIYNYLIVEPKLLDASDEKLNAYFFEPLVAMRAESVYSLDAENENLTKLGLDGSAYTLTFCEQGNTSVTIYFAKGPEGEDLAYRVGTPVIYSMSSESVPFLNLTLSDIASPFLTLHDIEEVERFTVYDGEKDYSFVLDHGETLQVSCADAVIDADAFRSLYGKAASIYISEMAQEPEEKELVLRLSYGRTDGSVQHVTFYRLDGRKCFAELDGEGDFAVKLSDVESFLNQMHSVLGY